MLYNLLKLLFRFILNIFFRDIEVVGVENVPKEGPLILVGNHHNQFVDPAILLTQSPRELRFLIAAKSLKRVMVGFFARVLHSIPVSRPQDLAKKGTGTLTCTASSTSIIGHGTKFLTQVRPGDLMWIRGLSKENEGVKIAEVKGDELLLVSQPMEQGITTPSDFKIIPHVDQSELYKEVTASLISGNCICLFPEGGSHDRADLLPLKAGVAVMALTAMAASYKAGNPQPVRIVPCGMNYFHGHRFRSHVLVEFGKPIEVTPDIMELYFKDRREAYASLLKIVEQRLKSVTVLAPDLQTLQAILICRRIYQPEHAEITADKYLELNRRFVEAYLHFQGEPQVQQLKRKALAYLEKLQTWGLHDHQVVNLPPLSAGDRYILLMGRLFVLVILLAFALPGIILNLPVGVAARTLAIRHAKQALAASNVKISGRDVIASYKILVAMVVWPVLHLLYAAVVVYEFGWKWGIFSWFVLFPLYAYASIRIFEVGKSIWDNNLLLFLSLFPGGDRYHKDLLAMREDIKKSIRTLVEELGPTMPFWKDRIFKDEQFTNSAAASPPNRVSYVKKDKKK